MYKFNILINLRLGYLKQGEIQDAALLSSKNKYKKGVWNLPSYANLYMYILRYIIYTWLTTSAPPPTQTSFSLITWFIPIFPHPFKVPTLWQEDAHILMKGGAIWGGGEGAEVIAQNRMVVLLWPVVCPVCTGQNTKGPIVQRAHCKVDSPTSPL